MRPIEDQTILITGSNSGIGAATARQLAQRGARVLMHGRDERRVREALRQVERDAGLGIRPEKIGFYIADFGSLQEVEELAQQVQDREERLDVLINNAGIGPGADRSRREVSTDGHELRFAVNYLAHFALTLRLISLLKKSAPSRIVNLSSIAQEPIDFIDPMLEACYNGSRAYSQSKLAMVMLTIELAERLKGNAITVNSLHPGTLLNTKMVREAFSQSYGEPDEGAEAVSYLATSADLSHVTGTYFDQKRPIQAHKQAYDKAAREKLWDLSVELTGLSWPGM